MQPRRTQAARSRTARDQIVQAALGVFAMKGYAAASMDDICLAAGCSKGGLYHHFPTKAAVLSAVVGRLASSGAIVPPFDGKPESPLPSAALGRVLVEIWTEAARDDALRAQLRAAYEAHADRRLPDAGLAEILRIGALIQLLTRGDVTQTAAIADRLGIRAA
jgi:AcrR family transcriptional regulator